MYQIEFIDVGDDTINFRRGQTLIYDDKLGDFRPETLLDRVKGWFASLLWWRQNRVEVVGIDADAGIIETRSLRWSWLKWAWIP